MDSILFNEVFLNNQDYEEQEKDPFYYELKESIEQSKRGESQFFDVNEYFRQHPLDKKRSI